MSVPFLLSSTGGFKLPAGWSIAGSTLTIPGATSGSFTITAPAVAGTANNPATISNTLIVATGSNGNPAIAFAGDTSTGFYRVAAGVGGFASASTSVAQFNGSGMAVKGLGMISVNAQDIGSAGDVTLNRPRDIYLTRNLLFSQGKGQHITTQAAQNDICGALAFAAATTASVTYTTAYTSTPVVVITPVSPGAVTFTLTASSTTGFTVTASSSTSVTVNYHVIGNPT